MTRPKWLWLTAAALVAFPLFASAQDAEPQTGRPGVIRLGPQPTTAEEPGGDEEPDEDDPDGGGDAPGAEPDEGPVRPPRGGRTPQPEADLPPVIEPRALVEGFEVEPSFEDPFDPLNPPRDLRVNIDFPDAELSELVVWFSALTGRNFIIADNVHEGKRITIIGATPVTIEEAYRAFMAALHMNGLTVVPYGEFLRIVPEDGINQQPFTPQGQAPRDDRMVTQIIQLNFTDAASMAELLNELKTPTAVIQVYAPTNTLIITETGTNLVRLLQLIEMMDTSGGEARFIYQVRYADAEELGATLLEIFSEENQTPAREERQTRRRRRRDEEEASNETVGEAAVRVSQIIADARTNQLIIVASPRSIEAIVEMAESLDVEIAGEGQIHVLFLENANATELAGTLQNLTQSVQQQREEEGQTRRRTSEDDDGGGDVSAGVGGVSATFTGEVSISADEPTNSLVVVSSLRDFIQLQNVVSQLDRRREQVYVEAVIMEITSDSQGTFGIAVNGGALPSLDGEDVPIFGGTQFGASFNSIVLDPTSLMGLAVGLRGPEVPGTTGLLAPGIGLPSFGAILQAIQTDQNVNVLSTPHILTTDNEEAEIIVGQNVPFVTGGSLGNVSGLLNQASGGEGSDLLDSIGGLGLGALSGLGNTFQVQRESVSLTLRIRPQINESNFVRLEIEERVEDIIAFDELRGPTTSNREARTVVVVEDQQTVVIGGLIQDSVTETVEKVPILGDIPVIGYLFRQTVTRNVKRNLLLLLTPYIIRDSSDFHEILRRKLREREEFLEFFGREQLDYVAGVDYSRKDGPLQSIFETIADAQENEDARRRAQGMYDTPQLLDGLRAAPLGADADEDDEERGRGRGRGRSERDGSDAD
jgi:general secretion pathway protein D